jgi:hypothetical protein
MAAINALAPFAIFVPAWKNIIISPPLVARFPAVGILYYRCFTFPAAGIF